MTHEVMVVQGDLNASMWVLACLLSLWSPPDAPSSPPAAVSSPNEPGAPSVDSMAPLYSAMRRVGSALGSGTASANAASSAEAYAQLAGAAAQSLCRCLPRPSCAVL